MGKRIYPHSDSRSPPESEPPCSRSRPLLSSYLSALHIALLSARHSPKAKLTAHCATQTGARSVPRARARATRTDAIGSTTHKHEHRRPNLQQTSPALQLHHRSSARVVHDSPLLRRDARANFRRASNLTDAIEDANVGCASFHGHLWTAARH